MGKEVDKAKGKMKQAVGDLTGNKDLQKQGKADERAGKAKGLVADVKEKADNVVDTVKEKVTKH